VTFLERLQASFAQLAEIVPSLLGAIGIIFVGYLVARLASRLFTALLKVVKFNELMLRGGVTRALDRGGHHFNPARIAGNLVFWLVMLVVIMTAASLFQLESLASVTGELVSSIPSVIAAIVIIIVGIVLGSFVSGLILASASGITGATTLARVGRGGVIMLAIFMALQEIGVATDIVTLAFGILFGAIALALALAFGLGNRDLAGEVTRAWYERYKAERQAMEREAELTELAEDAQDAAESKDKAPINPS
jgi:hypothetical protein